MLAGLSGVLAQLTQSSEPIPTGWLALGGALGITIVAVLMVRRLERGSIDDLEAALVRARQEIDRDVDEARDARAEAAAAQTAATLAQIDATAARRQLVVLNEERERLQRELVEQRLLVDELQRQLDEQRQQRD